MPKKMTKACKKSRFEKAVASARTAKGKKILETKLEKLNAQTSAIYTVMEHARAEDNLDSAYNTEIL